MSKAPSLREATLRTAVWTILVLCASDGAWPAGWVDALILFGALEILRTDAESPLADSRRSAHSTPEGASSSSCAGRAP